MPDSSELPDKIFLSGSDVTDKRKTDAQTEFINIALVGDLIDLFTAHDVMCPRTRSGLNSPCRCGLANLVERIRK